MRRSADGALAALALGTRVRVAEEGKILCTYTRRSENRVACVLPSAHATVYHGALSASVREAQMPLAVQAVWRPSVATPGPVLPIFVFVFSSLHDSSYRAKRRQTQSIVPSLSRAAAVDRYNIKQLSRVAAGKRRARRRPGNVIAPRRIPATVDGEVE